MPAGALHIRGLGKDYGSLTAVVGLDLELIEGEIFGLLGPNGAGKTTTISMIAGVVTPTRGDVSVAGHDTRRARTAARRALGLVPQDLALYDDLTARENLEFFGSLYGLSRGRLRDRVRDCLQLAGLADRASERVSRYSGGMKRRLNMVAGLVHEPSLLILDEPTVGVDPQSRAHIFEAVRTLRRDRGMTVLYTSHYMEEVEALCDRVGIMDHGRLIALDTVSGLVAAHGGGGIEVELADDTDDDTRQRARAAVGRLGDVDDVGGDDARLIVDGSVDLSAVVRAVDDAGARVRSLRQLEADLESVFLHLTGHSLRDD